MSRSSVPETSGEFVVCGSLPSSEGMKPPFISVLPPLPDFNRETRPSVPGSLILMCRSLRRSSFLALRSIKVIDWVRYPAF